MSKRSGRSLTKLRVDEIVTLAETIADAYGTEGCIEPENIVRAKEITLSYGHYEDAFDGMLECNREGRFHVYCNLDRVDHPESPRARFTLGHELGHYFIDEHRNALLLRHVSAHPSKCEYESNLVAEREADLFATHLLMPVSAFRARAKREKVGLDGILKLAKRFGTSITSTAIHYVQLGITPCAVIKWNRDGYAWKWLSRDTVEARYYRTTEDIQDLATESATWCALHGIQLPPRGYFETGSTASFWFKNVRADRWRNTILIEQAITLGQFGVLTFLYPDSGS